MTGKATSNFDSIAVRSKRNERSVSTDVQGRNGKARTKECEGHKKERDVGGGGGRREGGRAASVTLYFWQLSGHRFTTHGLGSRQPPSASAATGSGFWAGQFTTSTASMQGQLFSTLGDNMACRWGGVCGTGGAPLTLDQHEGGMGRKGTRGTGEGERERG